MLAFFRFLKGCLFIRVSGFSPERFMNLCSSHGILLWDIKPYPEYYEMHISLPDFYRIKPIVRKTKTKIHILEREGFPFTAIKWRKRKLFCSGFFVCLAGLLYLSTFIWAIDAEGNLRLTDEMLFRFLEEYEVTYGKKKSEIDIDAIEKALRNEFPFITWTSAKIDGTKLIIYVKENDILTGNEQTGEAQEPASLIADKNGVIESIITRSGVPYVKQGDEVKAGDVLIHGAIPIVADDQTVIKNELCKADGDVWIKSQQAYQDTLKLSYQKKKYTGKTKNIYSVTLFGSTFHIFKKPTDGMYSFVALEKQLKLLDDFYLPIYFEKKCYSQYVYEEKEYSKSEAEELLKKNLSSFCEDLEEKRVQILEKNVRIVKEEKQISMQGILTILEKADEYSPVEIIDTNFQEGTGVGYIE